MNDLRTMNWIEGLELALDFGSVIYDTETDKTYRVFDYILQCRTGPKDTKAAWLDITESTIGAFMAGTYVSNDAPAATCRSCGMRLDSSCG